MKKGVHILCHIHFTLLTRRAIVDSIWMKNVITFTTMISFSSVLRWHAVGGVVEV